MPCPVSERPLAAYRGAITQDGGHRDTRAAPEPAAELGPDLLPRAPRAEARPR